MIPIRDELTFIIIEFKHACKSDKSFCSILASELFKIYHFASSAYKNDLDPFDIL